MRTPSWPCVTDTQSCSTQSIFTAVSIPIYEILKNPLLRQLLVLFLDNSIMGKTRQYKNLL